VGLTERPERYVSYDREEWRRPWRSGDDPVTQGVTSRSDPEPGAATDRRPSDAGPTGPGQPTSGSWQRPDGTGTVAPVGGVDPTQPIARFPQPPPSGWDSGSAGPGSPPGSVRPPDTTGTVDAPTSRPARRSLLPTVIVALVTAVVATLATLALTGTDLTPGSDQAAPSPTADGPDTVTAPSIEPSGEGSIVPAVAEAVTPSVVRVDVSSGVPALGGDGGAPEGGGPGGGGPGGGLGSGVIYRSDGYVLTNFHVVDGAEDVNVRLASGDVLAAEIVGTDELNDLAVLQVEESGLPAINLRPDDEPLAVGETVIAIGSPFGLDASVTAGIISALNREIRLDEAQAGQPGLTIPSVLQTDAAINPGNSGGALVDAQGRLVGINTAILTRSGASQGVGFAVSAEQAVSSADQLIDVGFVRHPLLGIAGVDVTPDVAEQFDLAASRGAVIESVQEGTGAAEADLRPGDIIIEVDGEPLATMSELVAEVRRRDPGDIVELVIVRDGEERDVEVELGERPR
jgi:S1-C subfamily serine protease